MENKVYTFAEIIPIVCDRMHMLRYYCVTNDVRASVFSSDIL